VHGVLFLSRLPSIIANVNETWYQSARQEIKRLAEIASAKTIEEKAAKQSLRESEQLKHLVIVMTQGDAQVNAEGQEGAKH
jgi:hypothetical protein